MYQVIFYENKNGVSELYDTLQSMAASITTNKNARIQFKQITLYIELLKSRGIQLPINIAKHITEDIWELRPGDNRILYFYHQNNTFVLLHMFRKKSQKTPKQEIEKAIREKKDYLSRNGG